MYIQQVDLKTNGKYVEGGMSHAGDPGLLNWRPSGPLCAHGSHLEIKGITPQHIDSTVWGQCRTRSPLDMKKELLSYIT